MTKKYTIVVVSMFVWFVLMQAPGVMAQEDNLDELLDVPVTAESQQLLEAEDELVLPTSFLYRFQTLKEWWERKQAGTQEEQFQLALQHAQRRAQELSVMAKQEESPEMVAQWQERYEAAIARADQHAAEALTNREQHRQELFDRIQEHQQLFKSVQQDLPQRHGQVMQRVVRSAVSANKTILDELPEDARQQVVTKLQNRRQAIEQKQQKFDNFQDSFTEKADQKRTDLLQKRDSIKTRIRDVEAKKDEGWRSQAEELKSQLGEVTDSLQQYNQQEQRIRNMRPTQERERLSQKKEVRRDDSSDSRMQEADVQQRRERFEKEAESAKKENRRDRVRGATTVHEEPISIWEKLFGWIN